MTCHHCGATTDNGLALCALCQRMAETILDVLPVYFRNLSRWQRGRGGSRQVPGSRVLWEGETRDGDRITRALDETGNALTTRARTLADARPYLARLLDRLAAADVSEAEAMAWLCAGFRKYLTSLATLDWCGEWLREIDHHERRLRGLTVTAVPGWYAGLCKRCEMPTYVVPGLTWVTCGGCGVTTYARDHLEVVLTEARDWTAPPKKLAEALVALLDNEPSVVRLNNRIKQWGARDVIPTTRRLDADGDPVGTKRYRLGDVLDRLRAEGQTRTRDGVA